MWLISIQYKNLGALGTTGIPVQLDLQDPQFPLLEAVNQRDLPVILVSGKNGSGKTTLCAGIYFALKGSGTLNGRQIPKGIMTEGTSELAVALTVRHAGQAARFSTKNHEYRSDRITLVRSATTRQDGNEYAYYLINGHYNLLDPFPFGTKVSAEIYQKVLGSMGMNEGVIRAYEETLEQGSISKLASAASKDQSQLFDLLCRVAGAANARKDYELKRRKTRDDLFQLQKEVRLLDEKRMDLERLRSRKNDYTRLVAFKKEQEEQREKLNHWNANEYAAQRMQIDIRITILGRQIREKEQEIDSLKQGSVELIAQLQRADQEHHKLKTTQTNLQNELSATQTLLGQHQAFFSGISDVIKNTPAAAISKTQEEWEAELEMVRESFADATQKVKVLKKELAEIEQQISAFSDNASLNRFPEYVIGFSNRLRERGIEHHILADLLNISDSEWQVAIENYLGNSRFWTMIAGGKKDFDEAYKCVEEQRYRPGIRGPRNRPNRPENAYHGTVWELLDLPVKELGMWGYHLDGLGYQLIAHTTEEARVLSSKRPDMDIFSPTGMASRPDIYARSVMLYANQPGTLYCGKRAIELELTRLKIDKERIQSNLAIAEIELRKTKSDNDRCAELRSSCINYHISQGKLADSEAAVQETQQKLDESIEKKQAVDMQIDQKRDQLEDMRQQKSDMDRLIEVAKVEINQIQSKHGLLLQPLTVPNVRQLMLDDAKHQIEDALTQFTQDDQRVIQLEAIIREARELGQKADDEIKMLTRSINEIPESESLDATVLPRFNALDVVCSQVEQALEQKRTIFQTSMRAAKSEYLLLHQEMAQATAMVERQANQISGPLQVDFHIRLIMPDNSLFTENGDEFAALEMLNALENQEMAVQVKVRFSKDLRRDYRAISDSWASGGQREIACTALLGGILFAAQQMHAQGEITGNDWEKAPILMLDEPFGNLDLVNKSTLIGSLLLLPVQIIVLYPAPPMEFIQAADVVVAVVQSSGAENPTVLRLSRGIRTQTRADLAAIYRGDNPYGLAN